MNMDHQHLNAGQEKAKSSTILKYLDNSYVFGEHAVVLNVQTNEQGRPFLVLDETIFYPQGGGQPCDTGIIKTATSTFEVQDVQLNGDIVYHIGLHKSGRIKIGEEVELLIDAERRLLHSRIHSAGELICAAMLNLGYVDWKVAGAIHYPERSSVEYAGIVSDEEIRELQQKLELEVNKLIGNGEEVHIENVNTREQAELLCGFVPDYIPEGQSIRVVTVSGKLGRPCVGTHVRNTQEIGAITIRKIKSKKGKTIISYSLL